MWITNYGCSTAAGPGKKKFWDSLSTGASAPVEIQASGLLKNKTDALPNYRVHLRQDLSKNLTTRERLLKKLDDSWQDAGSPGLAGNIGVILASTKGCIEDYVWTEQSTPVDTLTPILEDFLSFTKIKPTRRAVVSNACSSVAASLKLAETWFTSKSVDQVVVISADTVGEFVVRGFHSLQALTTGERAMPFDQTRSGLQLGEAAAVIVLSAKPTSQLRLRGVGLNCEGVAATRPDEEGRSLYLALTEVLRDSEKPSAIVAHGTGTPLNDSTEDFVFNAIYSDASRPSITGTKWCVGHTLGVSAALDLIAAAGIIENKEIFSLGFTKTIDSKFKGNFVLKGTAFSSSSVLVSSLGFGGVHAGLHLTVEPS